jgi:hypothetical protein
MKNQTRPFTVVLLAPIAEQPIHALVAPSGDSILLSQDTESLYSRKLSRYDRI